jgi:hypothetical protein
MKKIITVAALAVTAIVTVGSSADAGAPAPVPIPYPNVPAPPPAPSLPISTGGSGGEDRFTPQGRVVVDADWNESVAVYVARVFQVGTDPDVLSFVTDELFAAPIIVD